MLLRRVAKEQIERVQRGEDPMGVQRGENPPMINTNIDEDWWGQNPDRARATDPKAEAKPAG